MDAAFTFSKERKEFNIFECIFYKICKIFREVLWCYHDILRFKYGSDGNYDGNDGFSTSQIKNKTRKNILVFSIRMSITMSVAKLVL